MVGQFAAAAAGSVESTDLAAVGSVAGGSEAVAAALAARVLTASAPGTGACCTWFSKRSLNSRIECKSNRLMPWQTCLHNLLAVDTQAAFGSWGNHCTEEEPVDTADTAVRNRQYAGNHTPAVASHIQNILQIEEFDQDEELDSGAYCI